MGSNCLISVDRYLNQDILQSEEATIYCPQIEDGPYFLHLVSTDSSKIKQAENLIREAIIVETITKGSTPVFLFTLYCAELVFCHKCCYSLGMGPTLLFTTALLSQISYTSANCENYRPTKKYNNVNWVYTTRVAKIDLVTIFDCDFRWYWTIDYVINN